MASGRGISQRAGSRLAPTAVDYPPRVTQEMGLRLGCHVIFFFFLFFCFFTSAGLGWTGLGPLLKLLLLLLLPCARTNQSHTLTHTHTGPTQASQSASVVSVAATRTPPYSIGSQEMQRSKHISMASPSHRCARFKPVMLKPKGACYGCTGPSVRLSQFRPWPSRMGIPARTRFAAILGRTSERDLPSAEPCGRIGRHLPAVINQGDLLTASLPAAAVCSVAMLSPAHWPNCSASSKCTAQYDPTGCQASLVSDATHGQSPGCGPCVASEKKTDAKLLLRHIHQPGHDIWRGAGHTCGTLPPL